MQAHHPAADPDALPTHEPWPLHDTPLGDGHWRSGKGQSALQNDDVFVVARSPTSHTPLPHTGSSVADTAAPAAMGDDDPAVDDALVRYDVSVCRGVLLGPP